MRNIYFLFYLIFLISVNNILGQIDQDVNQVLKTKDFDNFVKYTKNLIKVDKQHKIYWDYQRDVTNNYQEGIFLFQKTIFDKNTSNTLVFFYRVNIIYTNNEIILYDLIEEKNKKGIVNSKPYYLTIDKFINESKFNSLKIDFKNNYLSELDDNELFKNDLVVGTFCGEEGTPPSGALKIDEFVKNHDIKKLMSWLQSANTEKQLYAVKGFYKLREQGYRLNENELFIIRNILSKNGSIKICKGCIHMKSEISNFTKFYLDKF